MADSLTQTCNLLTYELCHKKQIVWITEYAFIKVIN